MAMPKPPEYVLKQRFESFVRNNFNYSAASKELKIARSTMQYSMDLWENTYPNAIALAKENQVKNKEILWTIPANHVIETKSSTALIGGDLHVWPGQEPAMWNAFCKIAWRLKPEIIVLNGDIIDGARVSRHGALLGQQAPKVNDEVIAAQKLLGMLPRAQQKIWTMGNHDIRVNNYLANQANELDEYVGRLEDRFPDWTFCYATTVNAEIGRAHV